MAKPLQRTHTCKQTVRLTAGKQRSFQPFSWVLKPYEEIAGCFLKFVFLSMAVWLFSRFSIKPFHRAFEIEIQQRGIAWWTDTKTTSCWTAYYCKGDKPLWSGVNELRAATTMAIDRIAVPNYFQGSHLCEESDHSVRQMHDDWFCCSQGIKFWTPTLKHNQLLHIWGSCKNRVIYNPLQAEGTPRYKGKILCRLKSRLGRAFATCLERWSLSYGTPYCNMTSSWVAAHWCQTVI